MDENTEYYWCELCGHVYRRTTWEANGNRCPNCGADLQYAHPWEEIRALNPRYPATPVVGREYTMYGGA